jgi:DNA-binding winged helix-turn-helix (wHTH) protein/tetratricopeptide (TPR) repeat protein
MNGAYRFGEYRINAAQRELWRGDERIALPPQVFDFLAYLVQHHDRAVGREEIVAAVWGKTEVSDTLLGQTVLRLRRELGDDAKQQRVLRTIPRFGYRWAAPLERDEEVARADVPESIESAPELAPVAVRRSYTTVYVSTFLIIVAAIAALWFARHQRAASIPAVADAGDRQNLSLAVLPATVDPGTEWAWMRLGVMDMIATRMRSSGLPSVPSEDVVALLKAPAANRSGSLRDAFAVKLIVVPHVQRVADGWEVELDVDDGAGRQYTAQGNSRDISAAAKEASDKLLVALGLEPGVPTRETTPDALLVQRVDAAVLADDPQTALALVAKASAEQQQLPELRLRLAKIDFRAGHLEPARQRLTALLGEAPADTAPVLRASILNGLGAIAIRSSDSHAANAAFGEAVTLLESHPDAEQSAQAYMGRANAAAQERKFDSATADYARARIAFREANDRLGLLRVSANEGFLDLDQNRPAQARPQFIAAAEGFTQWGALNEAIYAYLGQIGSDLLLLDYVSAMRALDAAESLAQRIENATTHESVLLAKGRVFAASGRIRESRDILERIRTTSADASAVAIASVVLAKIKFEASEPDASALAEKALASLGSPDNSAWRAEASLTMFRTHLHGGDMARAADDVADFDRWMTQADSPRGRVLLQLAKAELARRQSAPNWRDPYDIARKLAVDGGVPYEIATVISSYGDVLLTQGDLDAASTEIGRLSRWSDQDFTCAVLETRLYAALGRDETRQTALARARALAGERSIPDSALSAPVSSKIGER